MIHRQTWYDFPIILGILYLYTILAIVNVTLTFTIDIIGLLYQILWNLITVYNFLVKSVLDSLIS